MEEGGVNEVCDSQRATLASHCFDNDIKKECLFPIISVIVSPLCKYVVSDQFVQKGEIV